MTIPTEWVEARRTGVAYKPHMDAFGSNVEDNALLLEGNGAIVAIEGSREELLDLLDRMRRAVAPAALSHDLLVEHLWNAHMLTYAGRAVDTALLRKTHELDHSAEQISCHVHCGCGEVVYSPAPLCHDCGTPTGYDQEE